MLSKKEADINQTGYTSVGGYRVSTKTELRDPRVMARLADEIQQTDPEIKAMINRDVTLQNYKLDDSQIAGGIKEASITPYQRLKQKGFSDHDIAIQAKAAGMSLDDAKQSPVAQRIAHLLSSGRTSEAANRQVYDELTAQQMRDPSSQLMGDLFSVHKVTQDEHTDEWAIAQWKHQMDLADKFNGNFQLIPTSPVNTENLNPEDITDNYVKKQKALTGVQQSLQASVMVAAKKAGLLTGDTKKDLFTTQAITEDGTKLASLVDKLKSIDPILADRLQSAGNTYYQNRSELNSHKTNTEGIEEASGVDPKQLYQDYLKDLNSNKGISQKPLDYNAFLNGIRSKDDPNTSTLTRVVNALPGITNPYQDARNKYWDKVKGTTGSLGFWASVAGAGMTGDYEAIARKAGEAQGGFNKYKSAMRGYTTMNPVNDADYFGKMTGALEDQTKNNVLQVRDLSKTDDTPGTLASKIGIDPTTAAGREALKGTKVLFNNEPGPGGKVTASVFTPDGEHHVLALDNLDPTTQQDIYTRMYEAAGMTANSTYAKSRQQKVLSAAGQSTMNQISMIDLQNRQPSGQKYPINDKYAVRIITGGSEGKRYQLFRNNML